LGIFNSGSHHLPQGGEISR